MSSSKQTPTTAPVVVTAGANPTPAPARSYAKALALTISTGVSGTPKVHMGGAPFVFTANIVNDTASSSYPLFTLVVSVGHCSCNPSPMVSLAPTGAMAWNRDGAWTSIPYDREGGGMDYVGVDQGFGYLVIPSGASMHFTLRVSLDPNVPPYTPPTFVNGVSAIDVSLVQVDRSFFPQVPTARVPIDVLAS
jgi:hypothetical protein